MVKIKTRKTVQLWRRTSTADKRSMKQARSTGTAAKSRMEWVATSAVLPLVALEDAITVPLVAVKM